MSNLIVTNINGTSVPTEFDPDVSQQTLHAFMSVTMNGNTIRKSHNVSSFTDNGTGRASPSFTSPFVDANYCIATSGGHGAGSSQPAFAGPGYSNPQTTTCQIIWVNYSGSDQDVAYGGMVMTGDLA